MDDVRDDVIIARPFETDPRIFGAWHKYFNNSRHCWHSYAYSVGDICGTSLSTY